MIESTRFGRYHLQERLGSGAMGAVYRARDESLGRDVAIKTIHTAGRSAFQLEVFHARFENEARALAALTHPHVVNVFDVGVENDTPFLVMELVEGRSLADRLEQQGPLAPDEVCALGQQLSGALDAAHARGIVHRDVKPGNVLEASPGVWKLADFGVAHVPDSSLTLTGQFLGSPAYAAPEALERGEFGAPSDIYGLGATLYEALAGTPPFGSGGLLTVGALAESSTPRSLAELCPSVPAHVAGAIMGSVAREPRQRLTARQLADALAGRPAPPATHAVMVPAPPHSRRRIASLGIAAAMLVLGIALGVGLSSDDEPPPPATNAAPVGQPPMDRSPSPYRSGETSWQNEHQWRKVDEKLRRGKEREALEHLREILLRDPYDEQARSLYRDLSGDDWEEREEWEERREEWEEEWDD